MFKVIKDHKIIGISKEYPILSDAHDVEEDTEHTVEDYAQINGNGEFMLKSELPAPTEENQKRKRAEAYFLETDPITAHIQRLRDEAEPDEQRIAELLEERAEKVAEIQARYPYPEGEDEDEGGE